MQMTNKIFVNNYQKKNKFEFNYNTETFTAVSRKGNEILIADTTGKRF